MNNYQSTGNLQIYKSLYELVTNEVLPGTGLQPNEVWSALENTLTEFTSRNRELLNKRDALQQKIDNWHRQHAGQIDFTAYKRFLIDIDYLQPEVADFAISTRNVDSEIATIAGPQLVVPIINARYAINASNARWGSLYDALYGTNAIEWLEGEKTTTGYLPERGARVIAYAMDFLNDAVALDGCRYQDVQNFTVENETLRVTCPDNSATGLKAANGFIGYRGQPDAPDSLLLKHNGLHIEICIDKSSQIGQSHPAGISDVILESAITTIQDCEDSVAAVDAEDKTRVYQNMLGLFRGDLSTEVSKSRKTFTRTLNPDRSYTAADGSALTLPGRSLMFVRNVGHLMSTDTVLDRDGNEIPEGILDGFMTALIGIHDLKKIGKFQNSRTGSLYIVKPKMHGPDEVAFTCDLFTAIEEGLGLPANTMKVGIMDEERRTSVNLKNCIYQARERVVFINTGFLDRTGDEIHTSMLAGPVLRKEAMKQATWIQAYENNNVDIGLRCGFSGKAQIGKGMWAMPEEMAKMLATKLQHPLSGANTAWVPSPTAATLHALHYHKVDVFEVQKSIKDRQPANVDAILTIPLLGDQQLCADDIQQELENNCQGILGYVVRWIDQGIGCSTVPDINNTGLMEDRATLRISSQHIANWLHHGLVSEQQVKDAMAKMAAIVDRQNGADKNYINLSGNSQGFAYQAAMELVINGKNAPNGYTEPALHAWRRQCKQAKS